MQSLGLNINWGEGRPIEKPGVKESLLSYDWERGWLVGLGF